MENIILNERYELLELIGSGGMGHVYKAKDIKLDRTVAVKILKEEYLDDEEFVERFHNEAQAVAKLSHSNIVAVFDVGVDLDKHFIVMELIEGIILSDYVKKMGELQYQEAFSISIQIARALVHAHKNGIVHRDIKPHNVLLSKDGVAKVADFGIAKAATSRTFTLSGKTVGSVHYFSPEQARGGYVDARADLYSLGAVIYEMLTGRPPYDGETPVVVAVKHLQEKLVEPKMINTDIPDNVNKVVVKAMAKSADDRYQSAKEMLDEMEAVVAGKELPSEFNITMDFLNGTENAVNEMDMTKDFTPIAGTKEKGEEYDVPLVKYKKRHILSTTLSVLSAIVIMLLLTYFGITELMTTVLPDPEEYIVEDYRGMDFEEVKEKLENEFRIVVEKKGVYSEEVPAGEIIHQDKEQGIVFKELAINKIKLTVSLGAEEIEIPTLVSLEYRLAEPELKELGFNPVKIEINNDEFPIGQVIRTDPVEGQTANPGDTITVYISLGPELEDVTVPSLIGMTITQAKEKLYSLNLDIGSYIPNEPGENATIIQHLPEAGQIVPEGTKIELKLYVPVNKLLVPYEINPVDIDMQSEPIKVVLEATPSNTGITSIIYTKSHMKTAFPITVYVEIPENGATNLSLFVNNIPNFETILYYEDFIGTEGVQLIVVTPDVEEGTGEAEPQEGEPSE
ncbi:MAG: Stk1 family PASTA domain-containing Ser/Thr kinase [Clostridiales bacterium]|nr:Stk1 family PASTA domain-containing Ser/Thr kinase [Clostridiales bacterium]